MTQQEPDKRTLACVDPGSISEPIPTQPTHTGSLPPVASFLPSMQRHCEVTASTRGFDVASDPIFQDLMKDSLTTAFLAAISGGPRTASNFWTPGLILNRRAEARMLLEMATDQLRAVLQRFQGSATKKQLDFLMKPALDGIDARSYSTSYSGWKNDAMNGLKQMRKNKELEKPDKDELEALVTQIDERARTYWKLRNE